MDIQDAYILDRLDRLHTNLAHSLVNDYIQYGGLTAAQWVLAHKILGTTRW